MSRVFLAVALTTLALTSAVAADGGRVLILGDSHTVGPFGGALEGALRARGFDTELDAVCGASSSWWLGPKRARLSICWSMHGWGERNDPQSGAPSAPVPTAERLLSEKPDIVVFALGSNPDGSVQETAAAAGRLLALVPDGARCWWVGPPPMPKRRAAIDELYRELPAVLASAKIPCTLIDSRGLIHPADAAANDHFYGAPAVFWGRAAAAKIAP